MSVVITALLEGLAVACLIGLCAIGALFTRRVAIRRRGGTFDCSLRLTPAGETGAARAAAHFGVASASMRAHTSAPAHHSHHDSGPQSAGSGSVSGLGSESEMDPAPAAVSAQRQNGYSLLDPQHPQQHPNSAPHSNAHPNANANGHPNSQPHFRLPSVPHDQRGTRVPFSASGVRAGRGWSYGIAQYENDRIDWYRIFSYAYRPAAVLTRRDLEVLGRRDADGNEELALFPGWTIVECRFGSGLVELAMSPDALTGFLSWLEAAPPGQNVGRVS